MRTTSAQRRAALLLISVLAACDRGHATNQPSGETLQDTVATAREARSSLEGSAAPGAQTYSFRGLYAGMTRAKLEATIGAAVPDSSCRAVATRGHDDWVCAYEATMGPGRDRVSIEATYPRTAAPGEPIARIVTFTRELPLDVDGVRLAQLLADAFEQQTSLLDKRDAEYGRHAAMVRMGTLRGARENYADVNIQFRNGREILTVKLSRSDSAPVSQTGTPRPTPR
ncbi:hypothetical protein BH09GEM1_BH09GEM1_40620 [soil metagenome]